MKRMFRYARAVILLMLVFALAGCSAALTTSGLNRETVSAGTTAPINPSSGATMQTTTVHSPSETLASTTVSSPSPASMTTQAPSPTTATMTTTKTASVSTTKATTKIAATTTKVVLADGFSYMKLDAALRARITGMSYPADDSNAKITYDDLRYIRLLHYDFEGNIHEGELIVNAKLADEVTRIFYELYKAKYALASVRLVDDYGEPGDDNLSMAANNTSAFNYRRVTGTTTLSRHSYGAAIDINPRFNPYIVGSRIVPENGAEYADRTRDFAGKIDHQDLCYQLFIKRGWSWGGDWSGDKDYQHFSKNVT